MTLSQECLALGYKLDRNAKRWDGKKFPYRTSPDAGPGGTNYYNSKEHVIRWVAQVKMVRSWQEAAPVVFVERT